MSRLSKESAFSSVASTSQIDPEEEASTSASNRNLNVTLLSIEWKSTKGGLSTISRELAIQLAKHPNVEVSVYLPKCSEEDKKIAASLDVKLIEAEELPGLEPLLWLGSVPEYHGMDCVIGHGVQLGRQIPLIKRQNHHCKWIQIVHTAPEDLGMYKSYEEAISKGEQKHQGEVKLCEMADQVVAVGPKLADAFSRYLRPSKKDQDVLTLTPSIFNEFLGVEQATEERRRFCVLVFGRGDSEDFKLKGYDIAVQAVAELKDTSYQLMFVGAPAGKENEVADRLLQHGIPRNQLTVRCFKESRDQLAKLFCEVDLAIMPSRTEGFGLTALEALSAGLPVLVSGNSGLGVALEEVVCGSQCVVNSEDPKKWAKKIKGVREKRREVRLAESKLLRDKYLEKFRWQESCGLLLEKMRNLVFGSSETKGKKDKRPLPPFDNHPSKRPRRELSGRKELPRQMFKNLQQMQHHDVGKVFSKDALLARLERIVSNKGFVISDNEGSGNCMFYALCEQLHLVKGITISPEKLRQSIVQYLRKNPKLPDGTDLFNFINGYPSWADYLTNMEQDGTWGDHIILLAVANCYETYIHVISSQSDYQDVTISPDRHVVHTNPLVLGHIHEVHYVSLRPKQGPSGYGSPLKSVQYNQFPVSPVTQSSTPAYYTSHPQSPARIPAQPSEHGKRSSPSGTWVPNQKRLLTREDKESSSATSPNQHRLSTGHGLSTFLSILKAEYNRRSLLKPLLWNNTFKLPLEEVYTRLSIVSRRKTAFQVESAGVNMYDIFKFLNKGENALVLGSPGIGKTTFCLKISHDWTNGKIPNDSSFPVLKLLLLLKCRDIHGDIMEAISEQLIPYGIDEKSTKEIMDYIKDIHNQEKILIILDGLNELPKTAESHVDKLLYRRILPFCPVLCTSCQETGFILQQMDDFDILFQIKGFREQDAFEYIRKHFSHLDSSNLSKGERLIEAIQENTLLHALLNNPLNLLLLCVVFEDYQGELPSFCTELYQIIVRCLLRRYCAKHRMEAPCDDQALEKQFEDSLLVLGELAWRCLQEDRFCFHEEELVKFESKLKDPAARELGLVFKEASLEKINPQHEYHFFHKAFQEYLAATYLAHKLLKEEAKVFCEFELDFQENVTDEYRQVFLFVSGILGKDATVLFKQIGETLASKDWEWLECSEKEGTFFYESLKESQNAELVATVLCSFIPLPESSLHTDGNNVWSKWNTPRSTVLRNLEELLRTGDVIPSYVLARGKDAVSAYRRALEFGSVFDKRVKVVLIGQDRVGKTSLGKSLKGEPFNKDEPSTDGVQMSLPMKNVDLQPWSNFVLPHNTTVLDHKCALIISEDLRQQTINGMAEKGAEKQTGEQKRLESKQEPENSKEEKSEANEAEGKELGNVHEQEKGTSQKNEGAKDLGSAHEQEKCESNVVGHTASPVDGNHSGKRQEELNIPSFDYTISDQMSLLIEENLTSKKSIEDEGIWLVIWDFAGQTVYRAIHPLFMSPNAVYVLVSDLTKELSETAVCRVKERDHPERKVAAPDSEDTNLDHILRWMDSIYSLKQPESLPLRLGKSGKSLPPVVFVSTHVDKFDGNSEKEKISLELSSVLPQKFADHVTDCFVVDNTKAGSDQEDSEVVKLREHIKDLASEMPHIKKKIPLQWLYVEKEVYKTSSQGKKYITKQTFKDQIARPRCQFDSEDDIEELLHFLDARGTIVYHDCSKSEDSLVVLDPQWLTEVLCQIITAKPNKFQLLKRYKKLQTEGILAEELIDEACENLDLESIKESLISIMEAFNLIFKWKEEDGKFCYYVPCMLTMTQDVKNSGTSVGPASVYLTFNTEFVPSGLFSRLVVLFWEWASSKCSRKQPKLYANAAKFFIGCVNCIEFVCFKTVIRLRIWAQDSTNPVVNEPIICKEILRCLEGYLKRLGKECHWLYSTSWELCAQCSLCQEHTLCHWHKKTECCYDDCRHYIPLQSEPLCCENTPGDSSLLPYEVFDPWIQALNEMRKTVFASTSSSARKRKRKSPSCDVDTPPTKRPTARVTKVKQGVPDDEVLETLGENVSADWKKLGRRLKFPESRLEAFDKENDTCSEKAYQMLLRWKRVNGRVNGATYEVLYNALCHELMGRRDLAEQHCCYELDRNPDSE